MKQEGVQYSQNDEKGSGTYGIYYTQVKGAKPDDCVEDLTESSRNASKLAYAYKR